MMVVYSDTILVKTGIDHVDLTYVLSSDFWFDGEKTSWYPKLGISNGWFVLKQGKEFIG